MTLLYTKPSQNWHAELLADEFRRQARYDRSTRQWEVATGLGLTIDVEQDDRLPLRIRLDIDGQRFLCRHSRTTWHPSRDFAGVEAGRATFAIEEL